MSFILDWTLISLVATIVAGILGFSGVADRIGSIARTLFFVFLVIFIVSLIIKFL